MGVCLLVVSLVVVLIRPRVVASSDFGGRGLFQADSVSLWLVSPLCLFWSGVVIGVDISLWCWAFWRTTLSAS